MKKHRVLFTITGLLVFIYLGWRLLYTIPWQDSWFALTYGILLWISEVISAFTGAVLIWTKAKYRDQDKPLVDPSYFPDIDVFIATHNEPEDILYKTVNACLAMDYPDKRKVHIYISDDTDRPEMKALADHFGVGYIGMRNNKHAKSGNLNHAMLQTISPLIATFDADMIPYHTFLMETVPYFIDADTGAIRQDIGFIQTPQSFYNADVFHYNLFSEGTVPNEQDFFSREVNVLNNAHNAAVYTGSNTLILRQAIIDAGMFPTNTITEDFQLGLTINSLGYTSIATKEVQASGLTPTEIRSVIKQRTRWARGVIRSVYNSRILTNPRLSLSQRIVYLTNYMYWWSFARRLLYIIAPILFTVFSVRVVVADFWVLAIFWLPSYLLQNLSMAKVSSEIRTQRWGEIYETILAPFLVVPVFLESIGIRQNKFKVTSKKKTKSAVDAWLIVPHLILLLLAVYGLFRFNYGKYGSELFYGSIINFWLLHHISNLFFAVFFCLGRPIFRQFERFVAVESLVVKNRQGSFDATTMDISENGLSFKVGSPLYIEPHESIELLFKHQQSWVVLEGEVVRVVSRNDTWQYMIQLHPLDEETFRKYLLIIYGGHNQFLPVSRDIWKTPFDEMWSNIVIRYTQMTTKPKPTLKYPEIEIDQVMEVQGKPWHIEKFNYVSVWVHGDYHKIIENQRIKLFDQVMEISFNAYDEGEDLSNFRILNTNDFVLKHDFLETIEKGGKAS